MSVVCLSIYVSIYLFACLPACLPACRSRFFANHPIEIHTCASPLSAISDFVIAALNSLRSPLTNADKQKFAEAFLKYAMDVLERCVALFLPPSYPRTTWVSALPTDAELGDEAMPEVVHALFGLYNVCRSYRLTATV